MENTTRSLCSGWNQEHPGKERFELCVNIMSAMFLQLASVPSAFIKEMLIWLSKFAEFCEQMALNNTMPDYTNCAQEYGRAFGFCEEVFPDTNGSEFRKCFDMIELFETANPNTAVTKWRFFELYCDGNGKPDVCNEYHYIGEAVFSVETRYLDTQASELYYRYIFPVIGIITIIINGFTLYILSRRMPNNCNIFLLQMKSIFDTLLVIVQLPTILYLIVFRGYTDFISYNFCIIIILSIEFLPLMFHSMSIFITLGISFQKYFIITLPFKVKEYIRPKYARIYIWLAFCIILVIITPSLIVLFNMESVEVQSKDVFNKDITTMFIVLSNGSKQWMLPLNQSGFLLRTIILQFLLCFSLLTFEIIGIHRNIRYLSTRHALQEKNHTISTSKNQMQVVKMSLANVCIFLMAELPNTIGLFYVFSTSLSEVSLSERKLQTKDDKLIARILDTLTSLSSVSSLFVCILFSKTFRTACLNLLWISKCKKAHR